ncbi:MAG: hypothetical protein R3E53_21205 [Myxococcota bacterium]
MAMNENAVNEQGPEAEPHAAEHDPDGETSIDPIRQPAEGQPPGGHAEAESGHHDRGARGIEPEVGSCRTMRAARWTGV